MIAWTGERFEGMGITDEQQLQNRDWKIFNLLSLCPKITVLNNWASFAKGPAGGADLASQPDDVQVRWIICFRGEEIFKMGVRLFDGHPLGAESDAPGHTVDVRIHREGGFAQRKAQDDRSRLRSHAVEAGQPCPRLVHRQII